MTTEINLGLLRLIKRAEASEPQVLLKTFVGTGMLETLLTSKDHQIIYGRRGTGKTHALHYLAETKRAQGDLPVYLDLRIVGSSTGIFSDEKIPLPERGTRLLRDILTSIHTQLIQYAIDSDDLDLSIVGNQLDAFLDAATNVEIVGGEASLETRSTHSATDELQVALGGKVAPEGPSLSAQIGTGQGTSESREDKESISGQRRHRVNFGAIGQTLGQIVDSIKPRRIWILLDEWSAIPLDIQPYVADLIRRCVLPVPRVTTKIAAIEQRAEFQISGERGDYIGIEVGADVSADLNLDDFMVFENDSQKAISFFRRLIYNHYSAIRLQEDGVVIESSDELFAREAFTQKNALEELVRAAEGVPRDAINIIGLCAQRAIDSQISVGHVRAAAKTWYQRDKETSVSINQEARELLHWIVDEVIAHRKARAFLLISGLRNPIIDSLFDARVLHLLKRNISSQDEPGRRYDVYKIDYGCYVDLLTTTREPLGLLPADSDEQIEHAYIEVPPDDYRAIRRAIVDMSKFDSKKRVH
jgi:hypothetical protein